MVANVKIRIFAENHLCVRFLEAVAQPYFRAIWPVFLSYKQGFFTVFWVFCNRLLSYKKANSPENTYEKHNMSLLFSFSWKLKIVRGGIFKAVCLHLILGKCPKSRGKYLPLMAQSGYIYFQYGVALKYLLLSLNRCR